jgi:hypothetical protein
MPEASHIFGYRRPQSIQEGYSIRLATTSQYPL